MDKTLLISLRNDHKTTNTKISFICDNMKLYNENTDTIIWDDTAAVVHVIRTNDDYRTSVELPFTIESFSYDSIQFISSGMNYKKLKSMLDVLVTKSILTSEVEDIILAKFRPLDHNYDPLPGTNK